MPILQSPMHKLILQSIQTPECLKKVIKNAREEELAEENERKRRSKNLVLHGVNENEKDVRSWAVDLVKDLHVSVNIKKVSRIGIEREEKKRPILFEFESEDDKDKLFSNLGALKDIEKYKNLSIMEDLTTDQRRAIKELSEEAKKKNSDNESEQHVWRVRTSVKPKNGAEQRDQDFAIEQFSIFTTNIDSTSGRGIVILLHSSISHLAIQVAPVVQFEEACLLEIKLEGSDVMLFGCIYRSPTQTSGSDENNNNLNALVHRLSDNKRYSHVCLTGDFNFHINWHQWSTPFSSRSKEELFLETLRNSFLYQHVLEPTRR